MVGIYAQLEWYMYQLFIQWIRCMNKSEETIAEETYKSLLMEVLETNSFEGLVSTRKKITDYTTSVKTISKMGSRSCFEIRNNMEITV
jgi:hypothetical protein